MREDNESDQLLQSWFQQQQDLSDVDGTQMNLGDIPAGLVNVTLIMVNKERQMKYQLGPPLPFDFLAEDQKAAIIAQKEAEEAKKKAEELKYILSGISGSGGQIDKQKE
ncbi:MAG: hypothetical protein EZS28_024651 [Streblomastix strix]|uniref:Uncharacterized protein n=1 Tax=Streblomastix strix TaxID=222440 RepID=A0A5J4VBA9_9EUKA|nr:MAG: hypothetical protein EZS28_024651 [Streblomastix strix]